MSGKKGEGRTTAKSAFPVRMPSWKVAFALIILVYGLLSVYAASIETPTVDEFAHVPTGLSYWQTGQFELYGKSPPLARLWMALPAKLLLSLQLPPPPANPSGWGPWEFGQAFEYLNTKSYFQVFFLARLSIIALSILTSLLIFLWIRKLFDPWIAVLGAGLFLLSPTVLAHGHLATTDAAITLAVFAFVFSLRWPQTSRPALSAAVSGCLFGLAFATKFTAIAFFPLLVVSAFWPFRNWKSSLSYLAISICCAWFVVVCAYGFERPLTLMTTLKMGSTLLQKCQALWPSSIPLPLPRSLLKGFDAQLMDIEQGEFGNYLLGRWSANGWWYYNLLAFLFKETIAFILLVCLIVWAVVRRPPSRFDAVYLFLPMVLMSVSLLRAMHLQIGIRYLLPLFPFLAVAMAYPLSLLVRQPGLPRVLTGLAGVLLLVSLVLSFPSYISYFNALSGLAGKPDELLLDSNLDWGQDLYRLKDINREFPQDPIYLLYFGHVQPQHYGIKYKLPPAAPVKGIFAVSANFVRGYAYVAPAPNGTFMKVPRGYAEWLTAHKPLRAEGSIYLYDLR